MGVICEDLGALTNNNSTSKIVLDLLEPVKLIVWKVVIERVTVIKFRMENPSPFSYSHRPISTTLSEMTDANNILGVIQQTSRSKSQIAFD